MSKNRRIPFGYCMKNGEMIVENKEAETVRKIFDSYISGKSLLAIARELQIVDVPYNPDEENMWNKNMVKRILENEKYLENESYPAIVTSEMFQKANKRKTEKTENVSGIPKDLKIIRSLTYCARCEKRLERIGGNTRSGRWDCKNESCSRLDYRLTDKILIEAITDIINQAIEDPYILENKEEISVYSPNNAVACKKREIEHMIDSNADMERIKAEIFALAQLKYDCCTYNDGAEKTSDLMAILLGRPKLNDLDVDLLKSCVRRIWVSHFNIEIEFMNGIKLRKEVQ